MVTAEMFEKIKKNAGQTELETLYKRLLVLGVLNIDTQSATMTLKKQKFESMFGEDATYKELSGLKFIKWNYKGVAENG